MSTYGKLINPQTGKWEDINTGPSCWTYRSMVQRAAEKQRGRNLSYAEARNLKLPANIFYQLKADERRRKDLIAANKKAAACSLAKFKKQQKAQRDAEEAAKTQAQKSDEAAQTNLINQKMKLQAAGIEPKAESRLLKKGLAPLNLLDEMRATAAGRGYYRMFESKNAEKLAGGLSSLGIKNPHTQAAIQAVALGNPLAPLYSWTSDKAITAAGKENVRKLYNLEDTIEGSEFQRKVGWERPTGTGSGSMANKAARTATGFVIDYIQDPLSWVSMLLGASPSAAAVASDMSQSAAKTGTKASVRKVITKGMTGVRTRNVAKEMKRIGVAPDDVTRLLSTPFEELLKSPADQRTVVRAVTRAHPDFGALKGTVPLGNTMRRAGRAVVGKNPMGTMAPIYQEIPGISKMLGRALDDAVNITGLNKIPRAITTGGKYRRVFGDIAGENVRNALRQSHGEQRRLLAEETAKILSATTLGQGGSQKDVDNMLRSIGLNIEQTLPKAAVPLHNAPLVDTERKWFGDVAGVTPAQPANTVQQTMTSAGYTAAREADDNPTRLTTDMSWYDDIVGDKPFGDSRYEKVSDYYRAEKGVEGTLVEMTPDEYLQRVADARGITLAEVGEHRSQEAIASYAERMRSGERAPALMLKYSGEDSAGVLDGRDVYRNRRSPSGWMYIDDMPVEDIDAARIVPDQTVYFDQEGIHRALAAKQAGFNKVNVAVVVPTKGDAPRKFAATIDTQWPWSADAQQITPTTAGIGEAAGSTYKLGDVTQTAGEAVKPTAAQLRKIYALAQKQGIDKTQLHEMAGVASLNELDPNRASALIESLGGKAQTILPPAKAATVAEAVKVGRVEDLPGSVMFHGSPYGEITNPDVYSGKVRKEGPGFYLTEDPINAAAAYAAGATNRGIDAIRDIKPTISEFWLKDDIRILNQDAKLDDVARSIFGDILDDLEPEDSFTTAYRKLRHQMVDEGYSEGEVADRIVERVDQLYDVMTHVEGKMGKPHRVVQLLNPDAVESLGATTRVIASELPPPIKVPRPPASAFSTFAAKLDPVVDTAGAINVDKWEQNINKYMDANPKFRKQIERNVGVDNVRSYICSLRDILYEASDEALALEQPRGANVSADALEQGRAYVPGRVPKGIKAQELQTEIQRVFVRMARNCYADPQLAEDALRTIYDKFGIRSRRYGEEAMLRQLQTGRTTAELEKKIPTIQGRLSAGLVTETNPVVLAARRVAEAKKLASSEDLLTAMASAVGEQVDAKTAKKLNPAQLIRSHDSDKIWYVKDINQKGLIDQLYATRGIDVYNTFFDSVVANMASPFLTMMTVGRIGFTVTNTLGNMDFIIRNTATAPADVARSLSLTNRLRKFNGDVAQFGDELMTVGGREVRVQDFLRTAIDNGAISTPQVNISTVFSPNDTNFLYKIPGFKSYLKANQSVNNVSENGSRLSVYMTAKQRGMSDLAARDYTDKIMLDYELSDLTYPEQEARKFIPFWCVPVDNSEVLTRGGFKSAGDVVIGEEALTYNINSDKLEWQPILDVQTFEHDQPLTTWEDKRRMKLMFTDEHKWVSYNGRGFTNGKWYGGRETRKLRPASELASHNIVVNAELVSTENSIITPEQARLIGWIVTDGYHRWRGNHCEAMLYQSPKKPYFDEVVSVAGGTPRKPHPITGVVCVPVERTRCDEIKHLLNKENLPTVVTRLSLESATAMFDAMMKAEGSVSKGTPSFSQNRGGVFEAFSILATLLGKQIGVPYERENQQSVYVRKTQSIKLSGLKRGSEHYTGCVWCPSTANGTWVMRQNGFITITGNTWTRRNIPATAQLAVERPGVFAAEMRIPRAITNNFSESGCTNKDVGYWDEYAKMDEFRRNAGMTSRVKLPVFGDSSMNVRVPVADPLGMFYGLQQLGKGHIGAAGKDVIGGLFGPGIKMGAEALTGTRQTGQAIEDTPAGWAEWAAKSIPSVGTFVNAYQKQGKPVERGGDPQAMTRALLSNLGIYNADWNEPAMQRGWNYQDIEGYQQQACTAEKRGVVIPSMADLEAPERKRLADIEAAQKAERLKLDAAGKLIPKPAKNMGKAGRAKKQGVIETTANGATAYQYSDGSIRWKRGKQQLGTQLPPDFRMSPELKAQIAGKPLRW
jgi:hypothetical protein